MDKKTVMKMVDELVELSDKWKVELKAVWKDPVWVVQ